MLPYLQWRRVLYRVPRPPGDPNSGDTQPLSNAIFVGGWYTLTDKFSMTSGTTAVSGVWPLPMNNADDKRPHELGWCSKNRACVHFLDTVKLRFFTNTNASWDLSQL